MNSLHPRILLLIWLLLAVGESRSVGALYESYSFDNLNLSIPDGNAAGMADFQTISSAIDAIASVSVTLDISGEFNGDLYGYLQHSSGFVVLLNRVGRTSSDPVGYADSGFLVTLSDAADHDIHSYQLWSTPASGSPLTGTWQPDARAVDPDAVLDTSSRSAYFSSFDGLDPDGEWSLFMADLEFGGESTLNGWTLELTAVPEPVEVALAIFGTAFGGIHLVRSRRVRNFLLQRMCRRGPQ